VQPNGDLWEHTMLVLQLLGDAWRKTIDQLGLDNADTEPSFALAFGTLLHDVGKPATMGRKGDRLTFYHHEHVGCQLASAICRRLRLSNADRQRVEWLVENHMYLADSKHMRLSKLKRTFVHPGFAELLALHRADALASSGSAEHVDYCEQLLRDMSHAELNPTTFLNGHDLVRMGLKPGPHFGKILDKVREAQLDGTIRSKKEAIALANRLCDDWAEAGYGLDCGLG
jgi:poly(A) polymerase